MVPGLQPNAMFALASLFPNQPASGPTVRYYQMDGATAVVVAENAHIVSSLTTSGILTGSATAATLLDVIADQIASQTALTGFVPAAVVVAPSVLSTLRKARGTSNDAFTFDPLSSARPACTASPWRVVCAVQRPGMISKITIS
jgi:hypothetical protein